MLASEAMKKLLYTFVIEKESIDRMAQRSIPAGTYRVLVDPKASDLVMLKAEMRGKALLGEDTWRHAYLTEQMIAQVMQHMATLEYVRTVVDDRIEIDLGTIALVPTVPQGVGLDAGT